MGELLYLNIQISEAETAALISALESDMERYKEVKLIHDLDKLLLEKIKNQCGMKDA